MLANIPVSPELEVRTCPNYEGGYAVKAYSLARGLSAAGTSNSERIAQSCSALVTKSPGLVNSS